MTATTSAPTTDESLSALLRTGTRGEHQAAESSAFVDRLLAGDLTAAAYTDLAAQLLHVYRALEQVGDSLADDPVGSTLVFEALRRAPALEHDLAVLSGADWRERPDVITPHPVTAAYTARILAGGLSGYVAHAYTRYLGDLSGGQIIARMVQRHYGIPEDALTFYRFPEIDKLKPFKDVYRARLDALTLTAEQRHAVVAESREAFRANRELFTVLGAAHLS